MKERIFLVIIFFTLLSSCKKHGDDIKVADELKYHFDFSQDDYTWLTDANHSVVSGSDGYYRMTQTQPSYQAWGIAPFNTINYNYSFGADAKLSLDNNYRGSIGIIYNFISAENYYAFYIQNNGGFYAFKYDGKKFTTLVTPAFSSAIKIGSGQVNHIEVRQSGSTASFIVNSKVVGSCTAPRGNGLVSAGVALSTFSSPYFTNVTGDFDNVTINRIQ